jgi:hypothetical protein
VQQRTADLVSFSYAVAAQWRSASTSFHSRIHLLSVELLLLLPNALQSTRCVATGNMFATSTISGVSNKLCLNNLISGDCGGRRTGAQGETRRVRPSEACTPFSHFLIVNKTSLAIALAVICWSPCAQRRCYPTGRCAYQPSVTS